jgi:uncharacterized protein (DUF58 family)
LTAAAGVVVPLLPALFWVPLASALLLLVVAATEWALLRSVRIEAFLAPSHALSLGAAESIGLDVRTGGRRPLRVTLRQVWPALLAQPATERSGLTRPGQVLHFEMPVRAVARGRALLEPPALGMTAWGFAELRVRPPVVSEVSVVPDLRAVGRLHAQLNSFALRGLGTRLSARLGKGREFDRLRDYVRGDEFRDVAWKASARHGRLIVREFRLDRSQDVLLCLDCGHLMAAPVAGLSRLDHAVNVAVLLSYVCNRVEDRVGLCSFASSVTMGPRPGRGRSHLRRLTSFAAGAQASHIHTDYVALAAELRRALRRRTLVVLFTALGERDPEPLVRAVRALSPPHLLLAVVLHDPDLEARARMLPGNRTELCQALVAQDLSTTRAQAIRELRQRGALVVESAPQDAGTAAMNAYIDVKRRQLL